MSRIVRALSMVVIVSAAARAQGSQQPPAAPRAVNLPDTLGAAFSIGDSATAKGTPNDFDFLVGMWTFTFQQRRPDGAFTPAFVGHWTAEKKLTANAFIEDHFRSDNQRTTMANGTWTYRVFNPSRGLWTMQGVGSESGAWEPGLCWSDGSNRYVLQHYGTTIMRIRYFNITDNGFLWRADQSNDNGKTWLLDWWTMEAKRVGK